jgi:hypothetical protein
VNQGQSASLAAIFLRPLAIVQISSWLSKAVPFIELGRCLHVSGNDTSGIIYCCHAAGKICIKLL